MSVIKVGKISDELRMRAWASSLVLGVALVAALVNWELPDGSTWIVGAAGVSALMICGALWDIRIFVRAKPLSQRATIRFATPWFQGGWIAVWVPLLVGIDRSIFLGDSGAEIAAASLVAMSVAASLLIMSLVALRKLHTLEAAGECVLIRRLSGPIGPWSEWGETGSARRKTRSISAETAATTP